MFFNSRKTYSSIEELTLIKMKSSVDGIFIFKNNKKALRYLSPNLTDKMGKMQPNDVGVSDIASLSNALNMLIGYGYAN